MGSSRPRKRPLIELLEAEGQAQMVYKFQILLPNGTTTRIILRDPVEEILLVEFILAIRREVGRSKQSESKRKIFWNKDIYLEDMSGDKIKQKICLRQFETNKWHMLRLHDGVGQSIDTFQNMWDLTPDTDLLAELPAEYTFETALADLIDNSLQAVWSNSPGERKLVSVMVDKNEILIFDSGPGMDASDKNCIVKWGKMGSSNHRSCREHGIGGKPPYLMPFFGMFGCGGAIASMHLGRRAIVASKTKESRNVYILHLAREALLNKSGSESSDYTWRTDGGIRKPLEEELQVSPHGSFTKVHIQEPKVKSLETFKLQCLLKDIYFPYIQCDEEASAKKTTMPIEFQVNGVDLAEIDGGEVAVTNLHSCNGPDFIFELRFFFSQVSDSSQSTGSNYSRKANARLRCVYFPVVKGKENINRILEKLEAEGCKIGEDFENFCRVSIRRNGRLLPDARWGRLPFMEPKLKVGDKARILKRCSSRVKCFVDTDAGFLPTTSKTDLALPDPFTVALKKFGEKPHGKDLDVIVEILMDGKQVNIMQLEREYQEWTLTMHGQYDEEMGSGEDEPVLVVCPSNKKKLAISSDVIRVHQVITRKNSLWRSGMTVKILKGAVGFLKSNLYATLEYIILEGFHGDAGGEARLIVRPLSYADDRGCLLLVSDGAASLNIRDSVSLPISVIDSGKCHVVDSETWKCQLAKRLEKTPSRIDILSGKQCHLLEIDGEDLPVDATISAGCSPPRNIVAVIRPANFVDSSSSVTLEQKHIIRDDLEMSLTVTRSVDSEGRHDDVLSFTECTKPLLHKGIYGLYIFPLGRKHPQLFHQAGVYSFRLSFTCKEMSSLFRMVSVTVRPSSTVGKWTFSSKRNGHLSGTSPLIFRVGSNMPYLSIASYDVYSNQLSFSSIPEINVEILAKGRTLSNVRKLKLALSSDKKNVEIMNILVESSRLDMIRPHYEADLVISLKNKSFSESASCKVLPGQLHSVTLLGSLKLRESLTPGYVMEEVLFEACDIYGNHVEEGIEVYVEVEGLCFLDHIGPNRKVGNEGYIDLSHILKVEASYGATVQLAVHCGGRNFFEKQFPVEKRDLRVVSNVPVTCAAGSLLENIIFEIFDPNGLVDESIHGPDHMLMITSDSNLDNIVQYNFYRGRCRVPFVQIPWEKGIFHFSASHTQHCGLRTSVKVCVVEGPKLDVVGAEDPILDIVPSCFPVNGSFLQDSSDQNHVHVDALLEYVIHFATKLDEEVAETAEVVRRHERRLKELQDQRSLIAKDIYELQAYLEPCILHQDDCLSRTKQQIVECIETKNGTASIFCFISKTIQFQESEVNLSQDVVGIVALLATVNDDRLSRVFADYLTENYMLALVLKSYKSASSLETYTKDGKVNHTCAIHKIVSQCGAKVDKRFTAIFLDEIRPYLDVLEESGHERKLALQHPCLPSGKIPRGFLGYAVNMINLDIRHSHIKTSSGYGLRETLFYCLFGELQVYQTWEDIEHAKGCIRSGAVSLDGRIMRANGIICLGDCDPEVKFPVIGTPPQKTPPLSQHAMMVLKQRDEKKTKMMRIEESMAEESTAYNKALRKFNKRRQRLADLMQDQKLANTKH